MDIFKEAIKVSVSSLDIKEEEKDADVISVS